MRELKWSNDLKETVIVQETLTAEEALDILTEELLGKDYYIVDPVSCEQANAIIVREILSKTRKIKKFW